MRRAVGVCRAEGREMTANLWWVSLTSGLVGALVTAGIGRIKDRSERRRIESGLWAFLRTELQMCGAIAKGYLDGGVEAPIYRMPLQAYEHSLPALLSTGKVGENDGERLVRYFVNAHAFNRALEHAQLALDRGDATRRQKEVDRARLKARKLRPGDPGTETHYDRAVAVVNGHLVRLGKPHAPSRSEGSRRLTLLPRASLL